jgi:hypothetical protein
VTYGQPFWFFDYRFRLKEYLTRHAPLPQKDQHSAQSKILFTEPQSVKRAQKKRGRSRAFLPAKSV